MTDIKDIKRVAKAYTIKQLLAMLAFELREIRQDTSRLVRQVMDLERTVRSK